MTHRENAMAILHYQPYERMPLVAFGYWNETVLKWAEEGHITREEALDYNSHGDNGWGDRQIMKKLGFDFNWASCIGSNVLFLPGFEREILETLPDGSQIVRDNMGLIVKEKPGTVSIPSEIGTTLTDREVWEREYLPRLQMDISRVPVEAASKLLPPEQREIPVGIQLGSLMGHMRNLLGVEQLSYLYADDEDLYAEIVDTLCGLCYD